MEQTQLLEWDEEDSTDGLDTTRGTPKPVGRLHLTSNKYGLENDFWIYPGENVIGRLESCHICLPASSVSKTHAVIEVPSTTGPHLLYDQGSLNRTRRHRVALIPQVRYSLQDGDTLLFGDVGCQYFILVPEAGSISPEDSMIVPPTQSRAEANVLAIEETPAPGRRLGFGQVLAQDSDREEEVVNGMEKTLHHPAKDGSDCSSKKGRGFTSPASSGVASPSATFIPESDEESRDPSVHDLSCPILHLSYDSQNADRGLIENGGALPSSRENSVEKSGTIEAESKSLPGAEKSTTKEKGTSAERGLVEGFYLDSDTDVEDENQVGCPSGKPVTVDLARNDRCLKMDTDTDLDDSFVVAPGPGAPEVGSDTDVEEAIESPGVLGLKPLSTSSENGGDDTDVEAEMENPRVVCEPDPSKKDDCKGMAGLKDSLDVPCPQSNQLGEKRDDDTDVEEPLDNQDMNVSEHEDADTDVSLKGETPGSPKKNQVVGRGNEGDTDGELVRRNWENSEIVCPQSICSSSSKDSRSNMEEIPLSHNSGVRHGDAVKLTATSKVEPEKSNNVGTKPPKDLNRKESLETPEHQDLSTHSLDSDTDMEAETDNPESEKSHQVLSAEPSKGSNVNHLGNPDTEPQRNPAPVQDRYSNPGADVTSVSPEKSVAQDSDMNGEEGSVPLPGKPLEDQGTPLIIPVASPVGGKHSTSSAVEVEPCHISCEGSEDTDGEREEFYSADNSNTDDEPDLTLQATQCFLFDDATPPRTKKAENITATALDSNCTVEEEPTQAFDLRLPFLPSGLSLGNATSSPLKGDESCQDDDMLETTQPFFEEPEQPLEEATQAFAAEEEPEESPQPDTPASASRGQEIPSPQLCMPLASPESSTLAAEGAVAEAPLCSMQSSPVGSRGPSTLQVEERVEEMCMEAAEGGRTSESMLIRSEAAPVDGEAEGSSAPGRKTRSARQALQPAKEEPPSALERRRSLRSSTSSASPTPVPERRSLRSQGSGKQAASSSRHRGLKQPRAADQRMTESEERPERPEGDGPRKKARDGDVIAAVPPSRARCSQRESRAASRATRGIAAAGSPGAGEPTRRVTRGSVSKPGLKEPPKTQVSRHSSSSSSSKLVTTPSPRDSGKDAKLGQESAQSTQSLRRRLPRGTESQPTGTRPPSCNRLRGSAASSNPAPKVLFTGVIDEEGERVVTELGGSLAESVFDCTHLVTDRVRRTVKFLCALARGIPIVTLDWLEKSRQNAFFLAPKSFLVSDPEQEKNLQFSLTASLQRAQQKGGLFQGYEIHVTPNAKPEPELMRDIVKCSGGTFLLRMPRAYKDKRIVVSCPEDLPRCKPAQEVGIPITSSEFILMGILQQKVELSAHRLDGHGSPPVAPSPAAASTRASKRKAATRTALPPPNTAKRRR